MEEQLRPTKKGYIPRDALVIIKDMPTQALIADYLSQYNVNLTMGTSNLDAITFFAKSGSADVVILDEGLESIVHSIEKNQDRKGSFTVLVADQIPERIKPDKVVSNYESLLEYVQSGQLFGDYMTNGDAQYSRGEDERLVPKLEQALRR